MSLRYNRLYQRGGSPAATDPQLAALLSLLAAGNAGEVLTAAPLATPIPAVWAPATTGSATDIQQRPDADKTTPPTAANGVLTVQSIHDDGTIVVWERPDDTTPFTVSATSIPGDGNPDLYPVVERANAARDVIPTVAEATNPKDGDMVPILLSDGTKQYFLYSGGAFQAPAQVTVEPSVPAEIDATGPFTGVAPSGVKFGLDVANQKIYGVDGSGNYAEIVTGVGSIEETLFVTNANLTVAPVDADLANPATTLRVVKIDDVTDSVVYWERAAAPGVFTITASTDDSIDTAYFDIEAADGDPLNVLPTVAETAAAVIAGSVARKVFLPSGRVEVFTHDGLAWIADYVVDSTDDDAPEILPLTTFPTAIQAFTPSVHGTLIRMRHAQTYTVTRTNDADAGTDPSVEVPAPTTDAWVTINYPTAASEYYEWDGAAWVPNTTGATSPGRWDTNMPSLAAGEKVTYYADVGPDFANATGYSVGIGGDNVADPDKSIRINLPAGSTLQGSAQANEYAELTQVGESITIIGLGNDDYLYENHPPLVQLDSSSATPAENLQQTVDLGNTTDKDIEYAAGVGPVILAPDGTKVRLTVNSALQIVGVPV